MNKDTIINGFIYAFLAIYVIALVFIPMADKTSDWYIVTSSSMEPTLNVGDMVYVSEIDPKNIQEGDVITFVVKDSGASITHRCLEVKEDRDGLYFITKGDANEEIDRFNVRDEDVIGKINGHDYFGHTFYNKIPRLGYLSRFAHTFLGFFTLIIIPGFAMIGIETYNVLLTLFKDEESGNDKKQKEFDDLYNKVKLNFKSVRETDIDIEKVKNLVKEANEYSQRRDYEKAVSKCEQIIKVIEDFNQYSEIVHDIETKLNDSPKYDKEFFENFEILELGKNFADKGKYTSALKIFESSGKPPILKKKI